jgi:hypothetical protein
MLNRSEHISLLIKSGQYNITVKCEKSVASDSHDYIVPWGTIRDNSRNIRFNTKLYNLFPQWPIYVLDLGCSGGGFVKDCIDDGHLAIGLEGADYSKKSKRAEWATIPEFLFTCDITSNFEILLTGGSKEEVLKFDVITSWDVLEHIEEDNIGNVASNVRKHLKNNGLWILSIATTDDVIEGVNLHRTVKPKSWWIRKFSDFGFKHIEECIYYINTQFIRGPKYGAPSSFHLALSLEDVGPAIPKENFITRIKDKWIGSFFQRELKSWVIGY